MIIKGLIVEDFVNYKKACMVIEMPYCDFKCDKENGCQLCQNSSLIKEKDIDISTEQILKTYYLKNPITKAIVFQGLEPLYEIGELIDSIKIIRTYTNDDIVIYTGYTEDESRIFIDKIKQYPNIIMKFGRFRPNQEPHYDDVLEVKLASNNQYGKIIS